MFLGQHVIAGHGVAETQFIERLIVNTLRLCIRLIGNQELVNTLLMLTQRLLNALRSLRNRRSSSIFNDF